MSKVSLKLSSGVSQTHLPPSDKCQPWMSQWFAEMLPANITSWRLGCSVKRLHSGSFGKDHGLGSA